MQVHHGRCNHARGDAAACRCPCHGVYHGKRRKPAQRALRAPSEVLEHVLRTLVRDELLRHAS